MYLLMHFEDQNCWRSTRLCRNFKSFLAMLTRHLNSFSHTHTTHNTWIRWMATNLSRSGSSVWHQGDDVQKVTVPREFSGMRVDKYLCKVMGLDIKKAQHLTKSGEIKIQWPIHGRTKGRTRAQFVRGGDKLLPNSVFHLPGFVNVPKTAITTSKDADDDDKSGKVGEKNTHEHDIIGKRSKSLILHEDEHVVVINKPFGIDLERFSVSSLEEYWGCTKVVHGLETHQAGTAILAKTDEVYQTMRKLQEKHKINTHYMALVMYPENPPSTAQGFIVGPLQAGAGAKDAKPFKTRFRFLDEEEGVGIWIHFSSFTAAKYQIRQHSVNYLKANIFGDRRHGRDWNYKLRSRFNLTDAEIRDNPLHCHAAKISFPHPVKGGQHVHASAPPPPHMQRSWAIWREKRLLGVDCVMLPKSYMSYFKKKKKNSGGNDNSSSSSSSSSSSKTDEATRKYK